MIKINSKTLPYFAMAMILVSFLISLLVFFLVSTWGSSTPDPSVPEQKPSQNNTEQVTQFQRRQFTTPYTGTEAVIFRLDDVAKGQNEEAVEQIIRLFGKNNVPLDVGVIPHSDGQDSYQIPSLRTYLDIGIIDISIHGDSHSPAEFDTTKSVLNHQLLKSNLVTARNQFQQYFGAAPIAFTVPNDFFSQDGYRAIQDAGFKIFSTQKAVETHPSIQAVDYDGNLSPNGMSRLCTVSDLAQWDAASQKWGAIFSPDTKNELFYSIDWGIKNLDVAVVGIHPQAFLDAAGAIDEGKLDKLDAIIKMVKQRNAVITFDGWYRYAVTELIGAPHQRKQKTPAFNGGPAIIFRMDDVAKGFYEDVVEQVIKVFEQNKVPMDAGIEPYANSRNTYNIPFLLKYLDAGVIDISMHGYKNTFLEFDTVLSGASFDQLDQSLRSGLQNSYGLIAYKPMKTNYEDLKAGLVKAREQFKRHFGVESVAFTVPYDFFNVDGYRAAQDAGFKVFSAQQATDPFPSATEPLDYFGRASKNGMYRLFSVSNTADWDSSHGQWGEALALGSPSDSLYGSIIYGLKSVMNTAVITMHPQAFTNDKDKADPAKLKILDSNIKYILDHRALFGQITTFQSWHEYASKRRPAETSP